MGKKYKVVVTGQLRDNANFGDVATIIASKFKIHASQINAFLDGQPKVVKVCDDENTAHIYKARLEDSGLVARIIEMKAINHKRDDYNKNPKNQDALDNNEESSISSTDICHLINKLSEHEARISALEEGISSHASLKRTSKEDVSGIGLFKSRATGLHSSITDRLQAVYFNMSDTINNNVLPAIAATRNAFLCNSWRPYFGAMIAIAACIWFYLTPYIAVANMRSAIESKDSKRFSQYVDFVAIRESVKSNLMISMANKTSKEKNKDSSGIIATALAAAFIGPIIDSIVTPEGLAMMLKGDKPMIGERNDQENISAKPSAASEPDKPNISMSYKGLSVFVVSITNKNSREQAFELIFNRDGFISWKLCSLQFPLD